MPLKPHRMNANLLKDCSHHPFRFGVLATRALVRPCYPDRGYVRLSLARGWLPTCVHFCDGPRPWSSPPRPGQDEVDVAKDRDRDEVAPPRLGLAGERASAASTTNRAETSWSATKGMPMMGTPKCIASRARGAMALRSQRTHASAPWAANRRPSASSSAPAALRRPDASCGGVAGLRWYTAVHALAHTMQ